MATDKIKLTRALDEDKVTLGAPTSTYNHLIDPTNGPKMCHTTRFTNLPIEIKEKIYEHAMRMDGQFVIPIHAAQADGASFDDGVYPQIHATCRTNKLERAIATLVMLRNSTVCLRRHTDAGIMTDWIQQATGDAKQGLSAVRSVEIRYMSRNGAIEDSQDMSFLESCLSLHVVSFKFSFKDLSGTGISLGQWPRPSLTSTEMLEKFKLSQLAACEKLRYVAVMIPNGIISTPQYNEVSKAIQAFKFKFAAVNCRELNVQLVCSDVYVGLIFRKDMQRNIGEQVVGFYDDNNGNYTMTKADWGEEDYEEDEDDGEEDEAEDSDSESDDDNQVDYDDGADDESDESDESDEDEDENDGEEGEDDDGEEEEEA
jgi:hypothetical protein